MTEATSGGTPADRESLLIEAGGSAAALIKARDWILDQFVERVRQAFPEARAPARPVLVNSLPLFLTELAERLSIQGQASGVRWSTVAVAHGNERVRLTGYSLDDLVHEYQVLRHLIFEALLQRAQLSAPEMHCINRSIDEAIRDATAAFVHKLDEWRTEFAAMLTHDIRGPLAAARNYVELMKRAGDSAEARGRFHAGAVRSLERVRKMIDDMLDHSRSRAGERIPLQLGHHDLVSLAREALVDISTSTASHVVLTAPSELRGVWCEAALKRAIFNLVENATKYSDPDRPISVAITEIAGNVLIAVHNFGPMIPPEARHRLFEAFTRGADAERSMKSGWGLGLAAVRLIAEAHGGSVVVESSDRDGTTFTIDLPRDAAEALRAAPGGEAGRSVIRKD